MFSHLINHLFIALAATTGKTRRKFWILRGSKLSKAVKFKFKCVFYREMAHKAETQLMANLPPLRLAPYIHHRFTSTHATISDLLRQGLERQNCQALQSVVYMPENKT